MVNMDCIFKITRANDMQLKGAEVRENRLHVPPTPLTPPLKRAFPLRKGLFKRQIIGLFEL